MGAQNAKQIQGQQLVEINHPKFTNAKFLEHKNTVSMVTSMGIEQRQYNEWKKQISTIKINPEYLLMPRNHQFSSKGFCGSTGTLTVQYDYFPYLLMEEITNRIKRHSIFQQCELWFLLFSLSAAQIQMKKLFDCRVGDIRPQNIFISEEGQVKVSCMYSWPKESSNFQKMFEQQSTLLSPEDMNRLQLSGTYDPKNYQSETFSIGMTILSAALLTDFVDIYDLKKMKFKYSQVNKYLQQWKTNKIYSEIFTAFISNLCSFEPEKRLTERQLWVWINKYEDQIKNKEDFFIERAPVKIQKEVQQLRGLANINLIHDQIPQQGVMTLPKHLIGSHDNSIVFPFMPGAPEQKIMSPPLPNMKNINPQISKPQSIPSNLVMSSRESLGQKNNIMLESINPNVLPAESIYTQIPAELLQKQFMTLPSAQFGQTKPNQLQSQLIEELPTQLPRQGTLPIHHFQGEYPYGVISGRGNLPNVFQQLSAQRVLNQPPEQSYLPSMISGDPQTGNYVFTRRIIDPKSGKVVAQQRIDQEQYQWGVTNKEQGEQKQQKQVQ